MAKSRRNPDSGQHVRPGTYWVRNRMHGVAGAVGKVVAVSDRTVTVRWGGGTDRPVKIERRHWDEALIAGKLEPSMWNHPAKLRGRFYYGIRASDRKHEVFVSSTTPTQRSHGQRYRVVVGPFGNARAAANAARIGLM